MDGADKREFDFPVRIARKPAAQADRPLRGDISVALPQREPDIWTDKTTWPFVPSGFLFVPDVLNRVGAAHFGAEWLGIEGIYSGSVSEFPRPKVVFDGDTDVILGREAYEAGKASVASMRQSLSPHRLRIRSRRTRTSRCTRTAPSPSSVTAPRWGRAFARRCR